MRFLSTPSKRRHGASRRCQRYFLHALAMIAVFLRGAEPGTGTSPMAGSIFFIDSDESLAELHEEPYDSEVLLQQLLVRYPILLAGDQIEPEG